MFMFHCIDMKTQFLSVEETMNEQKGQVIHQGNQLTGNTDIHGLEN